MDAKFVLALMCVCTMGVSGYQNIDGLGYKFHSQGLPYSQAEAQCQREGARLIATGMRCGTIKSKVLQQLNVPSNYDIWIGMKRHGSSFMWSDGEPITSCSANWKQGEPNNTGGNENCVHMENSNHQHKYNDNTCGKGFSYICEKVL